MIATEPQHLANGHRPAAPSHGLVEALLTELNDWVDSDPDRMSGRMVLRGTRFTIAQLLGEIAEGRSTSDIAESFAIEPRAIEGFLSNLAACLDRLLR